jgi:hypothetical protein
MHGIAQRRAAALGKRTVVAAATPRRSMPAVISAGERNCQSEGIVRVRDGKIAGALARRCRSLVSPPCAILLIDACSVKQRLQQRPSCIAGRRYNAPMEACCAGFSGQHAGDRRVRRLPRLAGRYGENVLRQPRSTSTRCLRKRAGAERIRTSGPCPTSATRRVRQSRTLARARGYYHEYTVKTPGVPSRGARRIVCGGAIASTSECYYSDDHYRSFKRIRQ